MTSYQLCRIFADYAEDLCFRNWQERRRPSYRLVYVSHFGTFWKFTTKEWWRFVSRNIDNRGTLDLPMSNALRTRPKHFRKDGSGNVFSTDATARCVEPTSWTTADWKAELEPAVENDSRPMPGGESTGPGTL